VRPTSVAALCDIHGNLPALEAVLAEVKEEATNLVVVGHNHVQFEPTVSGIRVINAGSVGLPNEDEPGAYWALLGPRVEHRRTPFAPRASTFPGWGAPRESRAEYLARAERLAVAA
jgi:hypothetical protein